MVLCDVCVKEESSVLCRADEAALCDACDRRVHRTNKVAGKHHRFSLSAASYSVCNSSARRSEGFSSAESRATLCKPCDASVRRANDLIMKHNRFILIGVHLRQDKLRLRLLRRCLRNKIGH